MNRIFHLVLAALALCFSLGLALPLAAHQTGKSVFVVHVRPETSVVDTLLTMPIIDAGDGAFGYGPEEHPWTREELAEKWPEIQPYLDRNVTVSNDGAPCEVTERKASPAGNEVWLLKAFNCEGPLGEVELANRAMLETPGGYRHLGRIQVGEEGDVTATVFNTQTPTYTVSVDKAVASFSGWESFWRYVWEGILHILIGLDHVLFVLGLVLLSVRLRQLLTVVTAFTISHSVTLALSALDLVAVPASIVEPIIALSVAWVAAEALMSRDDPRIAYVATFLLGFVHGFGFSYVLRDNVGLPTDALVPALLAFNVGVELGQLGIVALAYPARAWIRDKPWERKVVVGLCVAIGAIALFWFAERVYGLLQG